MAVSGDGLQWRTSSYSGGAQQCVEVAQTSDGGRLLRDTKDRRGPIHYFTADKWDAFISGVKHGEFD